jgi:hypothetical protein
VGCPDIARFTGTPLTGLPNEAICLLSWDSTSTPRLPQRIQLATSSKGVYMGWMEFKWVVAINTTIIH